MKWIVEENFSMRTVNLWCLSFDDKRVLEINGLERTWVEIGEAGEAKPTLTLSHYEAMDIFAALAESLSLPKFVADGQREDFLHERSRVDKLINYIIEE